MLNIIYNLLGPVWSASCYQSYLITHYNSPWSLGPHHVCLPPGTYKALTASAPVFPLPGIFFPQISIHLTTYLFLVSCSTLTLLIRQYIPIFNPNFKINPERLNIKAMIWNYAIWVIGSSFHWQTRSMEESKS